jgi:hypothetical protein
MMAKPMAVALAGIQSMVRQVSWARWRNDSLTKAGSVESLEGKRAELLVAVAQYRFENSGTR